MTSLVGEELEARAHAARAAAYNDPESVYTHMVSYTIVDHPHGHVPAVFTCPEKDVELHKQNLILQADSGRICELHIFKLDAPHVRYDHPHRRS